jgi:hypothetical protein
MSVAIPPLPHMLLGIILSSDLNWADPVNYRIKKPGRH